MIAVRYTPRLADLMPADAPDAAIGPAAWSGYLAFDHRDPVTANLDLRRALAHAIDRDALAGVAPANLVVATGGVVPPALQGHTPDIALRFEPDLAREHLERAGPPVPLRLAVLEENRPLIAAVVDSWRETLGLEVEVYPWTLEEVVRLRRPWDAAPIVITGWLPGYADPEYFLRLLFQSDSRTNEGGFSYPPFDELIERARQERSDRGRLELFHEADRMAVADRVALHPARVRAQHGRRQALGARLVGVRQDLGVVRRPGREADPEGAMSRPRPRSARSARPWPGSRSPRTFTPSA